MLQKQLMLNKSTTDSRYFYFDVTTTFWPYSNFLSFSQIIKPAALLESTWKAIRLSYNTCLWKVVYHWKSTETSFLAGPAVELFRKNVLVVCANKVIIIHHTCALYDCNGLIREYCNHVHFFAYGTHYLVPFASTREFIASSTTNTHLCTISCFCLITSTLLLINFTMVKYIYHAMWVNEGIWMLSVSTLSVKWTQCSSSITTSASMFVTLCDTSETKFLTWHFCKCISI